MRAILNMFWVAVCTLGTFAWAQQPYPEWKSMVRKYAQAHEWNAAMLIIERELGRTPHDTEAMAWRARVLLWSGQLNEAERQWQEVTSQAPNDPDNWMGLASVYLQEGEFDRAVAALDKALVLDTNRSDIHLVRGRALREMKKVEPAKQEYRRALALDPHSTEVKAEFLSLRAAPRNHLVMGSNTDFFNFAGTYQQNEIRLLSDWTPYLQTGILGGFYERAGLNASKFGASLTAKSPSLGAFTVGATEAHDEGIIPKNEVLFDYDRGWRISDHGPLRGIEIIYGQHWYWYTSARILALTGTSVVYLAREWTLSLGATGARTQFNLPRAGWTPSGTAKLTFPIHGGECCHLTGNVFYGAGSENFSQVDQIGSFSSHTYGGGLNLRLTGLQEISGFAAYQARSQERSDTSFGLTYGVRF